MDVPLGVFLPAAVIIALIVIPIGIALVTILLLKRMDRRGKRRSPLTDKLPYQAGAQARQRVDAITTAITERAMQVTLVGPMIMLALLLPRVKWSELRFGWGDWLIVSGTVLAVIGLAWRAVGLAKERRKWQDGMRAEIAAAQQLDRLQAQDCLVLHDIPAEKSNLDHVVVGPTAVFVVETKSRRKPGTGKVSATVAYDGNALKFPDWAETKPLAQARAQARWLSDYLNGETGEATPVIPVICLPGWFVQASPEGQRADVRVINPKMTGVFIATHQRARMDTARRNRIVHALHKRYPESSD